MAKENLVVIENTKLILRNFAGKATNYEPEDKPSFGVLISQEDADEFEAQGLPVKYLKPRHDEDVPIPFLKVRVNMKRDPAPLVVMKRFSEDGTLVDKTVLDQDTISTLDYADIADASLRLSIYEWTFQKKTGKSWYLHDLVCNLNADDFLTKYDLNDVYD